MIKFLSLLLLSSFAFGALTEPDKQQIVPRNLIQNGGFENGKATWTVSAGTFTLTTTASQIGSGAQAASWATGASSRTFRSPAITIPAGLFANAGVASCRVKGATAAHTISAFDGSNTLSSSTVTQVATYARATTNFVFPSSGTIQLRITSASSETLYIDDCYLGAAEGFNIGNSALATDWLNDLTFTPSAAYGTIAASDYRYKRIGDTMWVRGYFKLGTVAASTEYITLPTGLTIDTGKITSTTNTQTVGVGQRLTSANEPTYSTTGVSYVLFYDGSTNNQIFITHNSGDVTLKWTKSNGDGDFSSADVFEFSMALPIKEWAGTGTSFKPDQLANSWSGYHADNCDFARSNTAYGEFTMDASCTFTELTNSNFGTVTSYNDGTPGNNLPGIVFSPSRTGKYYVCAQYTQDIDQSSESYNWRLSDGTTVIAERYDQSDGGGANQLYPRNICGIYSAASTSSKTIKFLSKSASGTVHIQGQFTSPAITWTIFQIDQALPAPLIVNSVVSASSGVESIQRANIASGCTITSQSGSWISSASNTATGVCLINFAASAFSAAPTCICTSGDSGGSNGNKFCSIAVAPTTSSVKTQTNIISTSATGFDLDFGIICMGPK